MARRQCADAHQVHVVLHRLTRHLFRGGEKRSEVDVKAQIRKGRRDHLGPTVVAILAHFRHQDARPAACLRSEGVAHPTNLIVCLRTFHRP